MKLQPDQFGTAITAYGPGWVLVGQERVEHSLLLDSEHGLSAWNCTRFEDLSVEHFAHLVQARPEIVLFGSGPQLRFPPAAWIRPLIEVGIGVDTMDTAAACRTYNILAGEDRHVIAALLV